MKKNIQNKLSAPNIFFVLFLCIIAFRLSFTENISIDSFSLAGIYFDNLISIIISCVLIIASVAWFSVLFWKGKTYKYSGLEIGAVIFLAAAVISFFCASNKRASLNDSLTILAVITSAITLVQLLDSETKKKILLFFIIAAAILNVYQCIDQNTTGNKMMIEEYKANPKQQLQALGIEPDTFAQMLYEHRLNSKDVKGFFSTSNSAGSFFNLALFSAIAVFAGGIKKHKKDLKTIAFPVIIIAVLILGLILTASKGALVSLAIALFVLCCIYLFGKFINRHKVLIIGAATAVFIGAVLLMISYGIRHDTLPGGNSMLVRWEYWTAASELIADNFFTGIGGNNFGTHYTQYKAAKSLETVRDPHCFILTIFSGYGIIGLTGFLTCLLVPVFRAMKKTSQIGDNTKNISETLKKVAIPAVLVLICLRPLAIRSGLGSQIDVMIYVVAMLYVAPVFLFAVVLWVIARSKKCCEEFSIKRAALLCGILAVVLHNLIDFGIFEPGILMSLFAVIALTASYDEHHIVQLKMKYKYIPLNLTIVICAVCFWLFIIPAGKTAVNVETAKKISSYGYLEQAAVLAADAMDADVLNPSAANLKGTIERYLYQANPPENKAKLMDAEKSFMTAIDRDPADFKNYEKLSEVYQLLAEANPDRCAKWFQKALDALNQAIIRYPSGSELHLKAAALAQQLNETDEAIEHYIQTIAIEDAYREEFKIMYPDREMFSRIGEINYNFAKQRLEQLKEK
ncbi:MAG: O-antigen ligase family protein [Planctomycetaceae bacterium]|nr:O-antigen ligase family protein [Planctomycetaceae bacterium]